MSVFRGSISEYPGVIADHFILANCERGRIFFLSHCHKDHMTGLSSPNIVTALQRLHTHLLCSEVTQSLLLNDPEFTHLAPYLRGLPMEEPIVMSVEAANAHEMLNFTVTLLPAGHCPGSSMFFFQGSRGNVLYTGDFRLTLEETKRLKPLHCGGSLLDVSTLYVDTTFFHPIATKIPSRDTSRDLILKLIESWLAKSPKNVVHLQCAMFGYEHLYMGVLKRFKTKIHIAPWRMNAYRAISAVTDCLTTDGESTRIHACTYRKGQKGQPGLPCGSHHTGEDPPNILRVKPSTQWFLLSKESTAHPCVFLPQLNKFRVIHSMHASYSELCDFITYIKPRRIVPCVIPSGDTSLSDVCIRLKGLLPQTEVSSTVYSDQQQGPKRLSKKCADKKSAAEAADSDKGWSTGDESIHEFTNTEERNSMGEKPAFSHTEIPETHLSLPSLISAEGSKTSPPPSSDSVTLGSLKQSPIDLSLTPSFEPSSLPVVAENTPSASSPSVTDQVVTKSCELSTDILHVQGVNDNSDCTPKQPPPVKESNDDWSLKYECSPSESCTCSTPLSKRVRVSLASKPPLRRLFKSGSWIETEQRKEVHRSGSPSYIIDLTQDEQISVQPSDCLLIKKPLQMIDLTQDHMPSDLTFTDANKDCKVTENTPSTSTGTAAVVHDIHQKCSAVVPPIIVDLSDSQSTAGSSDSSQRSASLELCSGHDPFGSPNCLPPTPGRENICSILQRPEFP